MVLTKVKREHGMSYIPPKFLGPRRRRPHIVPKGRPYLVGPLPFEGRSHHVRSKVGRAPANSGLGLRASRRHIPAEGRLRPWHLKVLQLKVGLGLRTKGGLWTTTRPSHQKVDFKSLVMG